MEKELRDLVGRQNTHSTITGIEIDLLTPGSPRRFIQMRTFATSHSRKPGWPMVSTTWRFPTFRLGTISRSTRVSTSSSFPSMITSSPPRWRKYAGRPDLFVTSKGTLDKEDSTLREYLAQRANLVGAVRLPNDAFKRNANTRSPPTS